MGWRLGGSKGERGGERTGRVREVTREMERGNRGEEILSSIGRRERWVDSGRIILNHPFLHVFCTSLFECICSMIHTYIYTHT